MQLLKSSQILTNNSLKKMEEVERKMKNLEKENVKLNQRNNELELKFERLQENISSINRTVGIPGSPGLPGLRGPPGLPGLDGLDGNCAQECSPQHQVNFMAALSKIYQQKGDVAMKDWKRKCIPFDKVVSNQNSNGLGAYDNETGHFTAQVDGTYVFHVHVLRAQNSGPLFIHLMKNQEMVASGTNQDVKFETTSCSALLQLEAGDRICVSLRQGTMYGHSPSHYSTFSGFLIGRQPYRGPK